VFGLGPATRIYVALGATDMRKGYDGLYGLVRDRLGLEVRTGHLFLFANARRNRRIQSWLTSSRKGLRRRYSKSSTALYPLIGIGSGSQSIKSGYWKKDCGGTDREVRARQRKTFRRATGVAGVRAWREQRRGRSARANGNNCNCPLKRRASIRAGRNYRRIYPG
jgi:hypothetical protein